MKGKIAVFDVDGTLTEWDTFPFFLWYIESTFNFVRKSVYSIKGLLGYSLGLLPNGEAKQRVLRHFIGGRSAECLNESAQQFAAEVMPLLVRDEAVSRLRWHKEAGHTVVLASASLDLYLSHWGERVGADRVIATRLETNREGRFTGRIAGRNCHGPEKLRRLREAIPSLRETELYTYGDSDGDQQLLDAADHAFYRSFESSGELAIPLRRTRQYYSSR